MANENDITVRFYPGVFQQKIYRGMVEIVESVEAEAVNNVPVDQGELQNGIYSDVDPDQLVGVVGAIAKNEVGDEYSLYVHEGTGLYGPEKKKIVPKTARALRTPFGWRKSIKGQKANPFLRNAIKVVRPQFRKLFAEGFNKE